MKNLAIEAMIVASLMIGFNMQGWAQGPDIGKTEYQTSCAACHGADGKGAGPVAEELKIKPADLTTIAKRNNGVFPLERIYETIDGRREIKSHGVRDMPIWGFRYTLQGLSAATTNYVDPFYEPEAAIRRQILAIIDYLYRIQEK